jgi:hypothetical protein
MRWPNLPARYKQLQSRNFLLFYRCHCPYRMFKTDKVFYINFCCFCLSSRSSNANFYDETRQPCSVQTKLILPTIPICDRLRVLQAFLHTKISKFRDLGTWSIYKILCLSIQPFQIYRGWNFGVSHTICKWPPTLAWATSLLYHTVAQAALIRLLRGKVYVHAVREAC